MKFEKLVMAFVVIFLTANVAMAQKFLQGAFTFSKKKTSYITLNNGETVEGVLWDLDRKKGNIEEVTIKKTGSKKKTTYEPKDIKHMYLPPSGWDKMGKALDFMNDPRQWGADNELDSEKIKDGYAYFEQAEVKIKKKTMTLLMQLVNPSFEENLKVYFDPYAKETASLGVGGLKVAGGIAKSYFVQKGKSPAFKLEKKNYKDEASGLFGKCKAVKDLKSKWSDFEEAVFKHAKECN